MKDPVRVRTGRLGALACHARGHTNTAAAHVAFLARFEAEVDPHGVLAPEERVRRAAFARRAYFARLAAKRWAATREAEVSDDHRHVFDEQWYILDGPDQFVFLRCHVCGKQDGPPTKVKPDAKFVTLREAYDGHYDASVGVRSAHAREVD